MRRSTKHIAILLIALFAITLVPFNALHHHHEDEHTAAILSHKEEHSCELDERFCQDIFTGKCDHESHISAQHVKCFSCKFHFIKTFSAVSVYQTAEASGTQFHYFTITESTASAGVKSINNRGPPRA